MTCARHVCLGVLWVVLLGTGCTFVTLGITSRDWIQNENASIPVPPEPVDYTACNQYGCAALDYKVCSSCYTSLSSEVLCDAKEDSTGDKACGWLSSAGSCVGCDMLPTETSCSDTANCVWDGAATACKSFFEKAATSPPSNSWGIPCSDGKQQVLAGFHSCGLWQYSTSPVSTSEGLTCADGSLGEAVFGSSSDTSVCVTSFGAALGTSNRAGNPNQLWSIASSLASVSAPRGVCFTRASTGMAFMWLALGGGYISIFYRDFVVWNRYLPGIATVLCTTGTMLFLIGIKDAVPTNATLMDEDVFQELEVCKVCRGAGAMSSGADCHLGLGSIMMIVGCVFCLISSILGYYIPDAAEDLPPPKLLESMKASIPKLLSPKRFTFGVGARSRAKRSGKVTPMGVSRGGTTTSTTSSARRVKVLAAESASASAQEKPTVLGDINVSGWADDIVHAPHETHHPTHHHSGVGGGGGVGVGGGDGLVHDCEMCKTRTTDGKIDTTVNQWYCNECWREWEATTAAAAAEAAGATTGTNQASNAGILDETAAGGGGGGGGGGSNLLDRPTSPSAIEAGNKESVLKGTGGGGAAAAAGTGVGAGATATAAVDGAAAAAAIAAAAAATPLGTTINPYRKVKSSTATTLLENPRTPAEIIFAAGAAEHTIIPAASTAAAARDGANDNAATSAMQPGRIWKREEWGGGRATSPTESVQSDAVSLAFSISSAESAKFAAILDLGSADADDSDDSDANGDGGGGGGGGGGFF